MVVLTYGDININDYVLVRIHSECFTGNVLKSLHCDCYIQLQNSLQKIVDNGSGVVIYAFEHEGRGIGLFNKIKTYKLQKEGEDTVTANLKLGFPEENRDYTYCIEILKDININNIKLLTNNPDKINKIKNYFNDVILIPLETKFNKYNEKYLYTKINKMEHKIIKWNIK